MRGQFDRKGGTMVSKQSQTDGMLIIPSKLGGLKSGRNNSQLSIANRKNSLLIDVDSYSRKQESDFASTQQHVTSAQQTSVN